MYPVLFEVHGWPIHAYAVMVAVACVITWQVRKRELARLGYGHQPGFQWVGVGALVGAVVGSKVGMVLFMSPDQLGTLVDHLREWDFTGKTVVGGLAGGYLGVEIAKKIVGITTSTGDAWAVALPLGQAVGRVGCFLAGCCYGTVCSAPWAVEMMGAPRHPVQLYEALADLGLAAWLWSIRMQPRPAGHLFRRYLVGYAMIRFIAEIWRGEPTMTLGPLSLVQVACVLTMIGFGWLIIRGERAPTAAPS